MKNLKEKLDDLDRYVYDSIEEWTWMLLAFSAAAVLGLVSRVIRARGGR